MKAPQKEGKGLSGKKLVAIGLAALLLCLTALPLAFAGTSTFKGSDDQAKGAISGLDPRYRPWFQPLWKPPGTEIESLLFAVEAAIGSGVLCFGLGYYYGIRRGGKGRP